MDDQTTPLQEGSSDSSTLPPGAIADSIQNPETKPEPNKSRKALVGKWASRVRSAKGFFRKDFEQMEKDIKFAAGAQWNGGNNGRYVANIVQRHIAQKVASLYAKNPTIVCKRRQSMDFTLWDETMATVQAGAAQAQQATAMGQPVNPGLIQLVQDIAQGMNKRKLMDKIAMTAQILANYFLDNQIIPFKAQMKQATKRSSTTGVAYVKLGLKRAMQMRPEDAEMVSDISQKLERIQSEIYDLTDGDKTAADAEAEQLKLQLADLQAAPYEITEEGPVFDFPRSNALIVDPRCTQLTQFVGAHWVAQEFILTANDVKDIYHVDLKKGDYTAFDSPMDGEKPSSSSDSLYRDRDERGRFSKSADRCRVWEIYNKDDRMVYVVCEGYSDFLKEPGEPDVKIKRFWPFFALAFNESENDQRIYPQSDVFLIRDQQREYNRLRDGLREHRFANRPAMAVADGALDPEDVEKLINHPANAVLSIKALQPNAKIDDVLQSIKKPPIDPALYDDSQSFTDIQRIVGDQEANLGGTSNSTATESSIAESSRMTSMASNIDDMDDLLTNLSRALGELMFREISPDTARKICGPGAVWPQLSAEEISEELFLEIEAGSSGRPNKAAEMDNFTKLAPILLQIPGIDPVWLARQAVQRLDDRLDPTDALSAGLQSILAQNAAKQIAPQDPAASPHAQGPQGGNNAPAPQQVPQLGGGQPMQPQAQH